MARVSSPLRGWLIPRLSSAEYSAADSSNTEAGPRPGTPVPDDDGAQLVPRVAGEQSDALSVEVLGAGLPGSVRLGYRLSAEAADQLRGWQPPNAVTGWTPLLWADAATATYLLADIAVVAASQRIVAMAFEQSSPRTVFACRYQPYTGASGAVALPEYAATAARRVGGICEVAGVGLVAVVGDDRGWSCYGSADEGATWTGRAREVLGTDPAMTTPTRGRLRALPGGDLVLFLVESARVVQYASADLGSTFRQVVVWASGFTGSPDACALPSGRVGVAYVDSATGRPAWRAIGSAWEAVSSSLASVVLVSASTVSEVACWVEPDGRVYVAGRSSGSWLLWQSDDEGATWTAYAYGGPSTGDTATYATNLAAIAAAGRSWWAHQWAAAPGDEDLSVALLSLGGWSSVVFADESAATVSGDPRRAGTGYTAVAGATTATWLPFDEPGDITFWTATGAGADSLTAGYLAVVTTANARYYEPASALGTPGEIVVVGELQVVSGGTLNAGDISIRVALDAGASDYQVAVNFTTTQLRVRNVLAATTLATATVDTTTWLQVLVALDNTGRVHVAYRRPYESAWVVVYEGAAASGAVASGVQWGHFASATASSRWRSFQIVSGAGGRGWEAAGAATSAHNRLMGRTVSGVGVSLGDTADAGATLLSVADGPGVEGESYTIAPAADYPAMAALYDVQPSPRATWRTTGTAEATLGFVPDGTNDTGLGGRSWGLALLNVNVRTAYLEAWDGAAWATLGTWDGAIGTGLSYARTGNVVRVNGGSTLGRYIWRGELVGATVDLGGGKIRKIARHTEGVWSAAAGRHVELVLDGVDGTEGATGTCALWARSGVLVVHAISGLYDKFRVRLPSQSTADGYFEVGQVLAGEVLPAGQQWDWGAGQQWEPNADRSTDGAGVSRVRRRGPAVRVWSVSWSEGVDLSRLREANPDPDYLSEGGTEGMAAWQDVPYLLAGLLDELGSGEVPVVCLASIPVATGMVLDPTLFLYGRVESGVAHEHVLGDEGEDELIRVNQFTIREIP